MKMCEAFSKTHDVELLTYIYYNKGEKSVGAIFDFYNVSHSFKIKRLTFVKFKGSKYFFSFLKACYALIRWADVYYSRDFYTAMFLVNMGKQVVHEFHSPLKMKAGVLGWMTKRFFRKVKNVTVISNALKHQMLKDFNLPASKVIVAHDASVVPTTTDKIDLGAGFHIGYVGHLYVGKGMEIVGKLAHCMTNVQFHVVGGNQNDIESWKAKHGYFNLHYHGFIQQGSLSNYINAFDICLLPNQKIVRIWNDGKTNISDFTSPLKMFEYMAHQKPIIASDLAVLKEVLNNDNSILCNPENINEWQNAIHTLVNNKKLKQSISLQAYDDFINNYTWEKRSHRILKEIHE
ncbi:glycosyltransferase [Fulvivirga sp.]